MSAVEFTQIEVPRGVEWRDYAMCKGRTELFFAKKAERPQARERREARAMKLCTVCPVQTACRTWARENREYGFWANVNPEVNHPRWSQARERRIGQGVFAPKQPTLMFNGYEEYVADLYKDLDLRRNY